jgi:hypothetical protein
MIAVDHRMRYQRRRWSLVSLLQAWALLWLSVPNLWTARPCVDPTPLTCEHDDIARAAPMTPQPAGRPADEIAASAPSEKKDAKQPGADAAAAASAAERELLARRVTRTFERVRNAATARQREGRLRNRGPPRG